jgi:phage terminase large subunit
MKPLTTKPQTQISLSLPKKLCGFFTPGHRFYVLHGGRGSAKSWSVAKFLILEGITNPHRILCGREIQKSIKESVKKLLDSEIDRMGLRWFYRSTDTSIVGINGTEFIFAGLRHNSESIKSMEGITICWIEEAQTISRDSLETLKPTIRLPNSRIFLTMNPRFEDDPAYEDFIKPGDDLRSDARSIQLNYLDNPWFSQVLRDEMEHMKRTNYSVYEHIWLGKILVDQEGLVFRNIKVDWFEPDSKTQFLFGADFGFSKDPNTLNRCWMSECEKYIYIDYEANGVGVEIDDMPAMYDQIPESRRWPIVGDSARPETISYMRRKGFAISGAKKGKGSIEDGTVFLQGKIIYIHPRCKHTLAEFKSHKYKRHRDTNKILPQVEDVDNHHIDGVRYAFEGKWMRGGFRAGAV